MSFGNGGWSLDFDRLKAGADDLMRLITQILPGLPDNASYGAAAASNTLARAMPGMVRNALGTQQTPPNLVLYAGSEAGSASSGAALRVDGGVAPSLP